MKKFNVAVVVSGFVEGESPSAVREKLEGTLGVFDFVDSLKTVLKFKEGDFLQADFADLLVPTPVDDRFFVIVIDKKHICPADIRYQAGELCMDSEKCPYVGSFSCPFIAPALLNSPYHRALPRCPFDEGD